MAGSKSTAVLVTLCLFLGISHAQQDIPSGIVVSTQYYAFVHGTSHDHWGKIQRYNIVNNSPQFFGDIYTGSNARCANISPNGDKVAFLRSDNKICIINIDGSGSVNVIGDMGANDGSLDWPMQSWIYYASYNNSTLFRVNTSSGAVETVGNTTLSHPWMVSVSQDGTRGGFAANHDGWSTWTLNISSSGISNVRKVGACGGSIAPDGSLVTQNIGDHQTIKIHDFSSHAVVKTWTTSKCASAGYKWNRHRWSNNSRDWVCLTQGAPHQMENYHNPVLYYVPDNGSTNIQVTNNSNGTYNECDDFWIQQHTSPVLKLSPTELAFETTVGSNPSSKNVAASNSGAGTLPGLSASSSESWCTATVSGSGDSRQIATAINVSGLDGGQYTATVTVSGSGIDAATYSVSLKVVAPPVLTTVTVADATVEPGKQVQLTARALDQYGDAIDPQPTFTWEKVSGEGSLSSSGVFAATDNEGTATVRASTGGKSDDATVTIRVAPPVHIKVNCGGSGVVGWEDNLAYLSGTPGTPSFEFPGPHDLTGATNAAPHDVYKTTTLDPSKNTYVFPDLPTGTYTVRIHFVLGSEHTSTFNMDYSIEGKEVLSDFDIKTDAGGYNKAVVKEYEVTVSDGNLELVGTNDGGPRVFCSGIEVIAGGIQASTPVIRVTSPNGGESFVTGDVITIEYEGDPDKFDAAVIQLSVDGGLSWTSISGESSFTAFKDGATKGSFEWTVPEKLNGAQLKSSECKIKIYEYMANNLNDVSDASFSINTDVATGPLPRIQSHGSIRVTNAGITVNSSVNDECRVLVVDLSGRCVYQTSSNSSLSLQWKETGLAPGVYMTSILSRGKISSHKVRLTR